MSSMKYDQGYREQIRLKAKNDFNQDLTEPQIDMCIYTEEQEKLSFFHGHLYINPRRMMIDNQWINKIQWSKSIDGYRVLAQRNGLCRVDEPSWQSDKDGNLFCCRVTVWRRGPDGYPEGPFVGIAHYHEYVQLVDEYDDKRKKTGKKSPNRQWQTSPMNQLAICAERQAHRKAGLDHTNLSEDIVDIEPRETVDEAHEADGMAEHVDAPVADVAPEPAAMLEYEKSHRGFQYRGAMIVMTVSGPKWHAVMLDDGRKVVFGREGAVLTEQEVTDRDYEFAGGAEWIDGSVYYDKSRVVAVVTKGRNAVLELDSGFKVKLDQWGKEVGRKELERPKEERAGAAQDDGDAAAAGDAAAPEAEVDAGDDDSQKGTEAFAKAMLLAEDCSGAAVEDLRKGMIALLIFWCQNLNNGVKISPKEAYLTLVGVAIGDGDRMRAEDYRALLETLHEKIQEKAA